MSLSGSLFLSLALFLDLKPPLLSQHALPQSGVHEEQHGPRDCTSHHSPAPNRDPCQKAVTQFRVCKVSILGVRYKLVNFGALKKKDRQIGGQE